MKDRCRYEEHINQIFSYMSEDSQRKAVEKILYNFKLIERPDFSTVTTNYRIDFLNHILNSISRNVIVEKTEQLKDIIEKYGDKKDGEFVNKSKEILELIDLCNNPEKYDEMSKTDTRDLVIGLDNEKYDRLFKIVIEKDEYALVNDDFMASLYQASVNNLFLYNIKKKFETLMKKSKKPDMSKYDGYVEELSDMDNLTFRNFMEDLKKLKCSVGTLPEKYCDYLIKQKINPESDLNKNLDQYFQIFKRAFEDKNQYVLKKDNIDEYIVQASSDLDEELFGVAGFKFIKHSDKSIRDLGVENMEAIDTMFHESRHALQTKHINSG